MTDTVRLTFVTGAIILPVLETRIVGDTIHTVEVRPSRWVPDSVARAVLGLDGPAAHRVADNMLGPPE